MAMKIGNVFLVIVAARYLGVENFGQFSFIISLTTLFLTLTDAGINFYSIREIARDKNLAPTIFGNALMLKTFLAFIAIAILNGIVAIFHYTPQEALGFKIASLMLFLDTAIQQVYAMFRAHQKMEYESIGLIIETTIIVSLGITVLLMGYSYLALLAIYILAKAINFTFSFNLCLRKITPITWFWNPGFSKELLKKSFPFALNMIFGLVAFRLDIILLRSLKDAYYVGIYRATLSIIFTVIIFAGMYQTAIYPILSRLFLSSLEKLKYAIESSMSILLFVSFGIAILLYKFADVIILTIFGQDYAPSIVIFRILVLMLPLKFINQVLGITLDAINKQNIRPYIAGTCIVINGVLNFIFISLFSAKGAAVATILTEFSIFILYYFFIKRYLYAVPLQKSFAKASFAAILAYIGMLNTFQLPIILSALIGIIVYLLTLYVLKAQKDIGLELLLQGFSPGNNLSAS